MSIINCFVEPLFLYTIKDGSTYERALKNVQEIIDDWKDIPAPLGKLMYA